MKNLFYLIILTVLSCNNPINQTDVKNNTDKTKQISTTPQKEKSKHYTEKDTISIETEIGYTLKFTKTEFNKIVDEHPELFQDHIQNPDQLYHCFVKSVDFSSEQGQDIYYALYAYFLKQKNGAEEFKQQRKKLIEIFSNINSLFAHFQYGGTYFGHQGLRILGYAEFSIYLYPKGEKTYDQFEKTYDITKQKDLYIKSLRQLIDDERKIDFETMGKEKIERTKKLNKMVDELNLLITNIFYLRRAQEFQYNCYEYY